MFEQHFISYLREKQRISESQYAQIRNLQQSTRVKLGLIAVAENLLTNKQTEKLNILQRQTDQRFGDLAVEKGFLTPSQVDGLLKKQGNSYLQLIQILTENGILNMNQIENALRDYQTQNDFSDADVAAFRTGDLDSIIPVFVKTDSTLATKYMSLALRNLVRFVDSEPLIQRVQTTKTYNFGNLAYQTVLGDHQLLLGFASSDDHLIAIASPFGREYFSRVDEDAFDAVCEFINCINGLFSTELSYKDIVIDMQPPLTAQNQKLEGADEFYVVPITLNDQRVDLIVAIDVDIKII